MDPKIKQLETLTQFSTNLAKKISGHDDEHAVESLIETLVRKLDVVPGEVVGLRKEAMSLYKVADFLEKFAEDKAKQKTKEVSKDEIKKVKETLMEALGIRSEMVDLLLKSASPEELKAVASTIRQEADKRSHSAESIAHKDREDKLRKITELQSIRSNLDLSHMDIVTQNKFIALKREIMRSEADRPIKELCQEMEGKSSA